MKRKYIRKNLVINPGRTKMVPLVITSENLYMKLIWVDILGNSIEYGVNEIQTVACFSKNRFATGITPIISFTNSPRLATLNRLSVISYLTL